MNFKFNFQKIITHYVTFFLSKICSEISCTYLDYKCTVPSLIIKLALGTKWARTATDSPLERIDERECVWLTRRRLRSLSLSFSCFCRCVICLSVCSVLSLSPSFICSFSLSTCLWTCRKATTAHTHTKQAVCVQFCTHTQSIIQKYITWHLYLYANYVCIPAFVCSLLAVLSWASMSLSFSAHTLSTSDTFCKTAQTSTSSKISNCTL